MELLFPSLAIFQLPGRNACNLGNVSAKNSIFICSNLAPEVWPTALSCSCTESHNCLAIPVAIFMDRFDALSALLGIPFLSIVNTQLVINL